jgi:hypothetical protein
MPSSNLDCCIYYGILIDKNDLHSTAIFDGCNNILDFLSKHEFDYRLIGSSSYSKKMVVGKEIHWDYGSYVTEVTFNDNKINLHSTLEMENDSFQINNNLEFNNEETDQKLKIAGISLVPKFYIITSKE